jgi:hypothetical protein
MYSIQKYTASSRFNIEIYEKTKQNSMMDKSKINWVLSVYVTHENCHDKNNINYKMQKRESVTLNTQIFKVKHMNLYIF